MSIIESIAVILLSSSIASSGVSFLTLLFRHWLHNPDNAQELERFYADLKTLFKKTAQYNEINPNEWR